MTVKRVLQNAAVTHPWNELLSIVLEKLYSLLSFWNVGEHLELVKLLRNSGDPSWLVYFS